MRFSDLRFLIVLAFPAWLLVTVLNAPQSAGRGALLVFLVVALSEILLPAARHSPPALDESAQRARYFRWLIRAYVPLQLALVASAVWAAMNLNVMQAITVGAAVGFVCGSLGITLAHELGHSKSKIDRFCGWLLMTSVGYGHFMVEHYRGHHPRAATFDDPASARRGESLYAFLPRTLFGGTRSGFSLEAARLRVMKKTWGQSPLLLATLGSAALLIVPALISPHTATSHIAVMLSCWCVAILLLECVNYIEHYGLQRSVSEKGKREPFGIGHAWNADHIVTNSLLINLQRHSDHHMHAWKPYETLEPLPGPQLPTGYAGAIVLAMLPPVWFWTMHARLDALTAARTAQV